MHYISLTTVQENVWVGSLLTNHSWRQCRTWLDNLSYTKGWRKELNLISWNNRDLKYDIHDWSEDHNIMGKGVTLDKEELIAL